MRTLDRLSSTAPLAWLRNGVDRFRRALMARSPLVRASLIVALVLGLVASIYWGTAALVPTGMRYLASGRTFSSDDLTRIGQALDEKGISYRIDDRKVEVSADQYDQAVGAFAKVRVGSPSFEEIRSSEDLLDSIIGTSQDRERKELLRQERFIEGCLNKLDGIVASYVSIRWTRLPGPRHLRGKPSAYVMIETDPSRPLPWRTRQAIPTILISNEPDLTEQSITAIDSRGDPIYNPRDPAQTNLSRDQAREEEVRKNILEKLSYIKNVRVSVRLIERHDGPRRSTSTAAAAAHRPRHQPGPVMGVNVPVALDEPTPTTVDSAPESPGMPASAPEQGQVVVNVPRSYYLNHMWPTADQREPTPEALKESAVRTKEQIIRLVKLVVPSWRVEVDTFPDDGPVGRRAALPDARRKVTDWGIVASVAAGVALLTALASWIQVVRRPARLPEMEVRTRRFRADSDDEPNPSERVRELVRRDPEAAASVLQRWTTQGGRVS